MRSWKSAEIYRPIQRNVVLYDGPSRFTGDRIFVIATAQNGNRKIGRMLQLWIIPAMSPIEALRTGADAAVCGNCRFRGDGHGKNRICYVWSPGVENIWQSQFRADRTDHLTPSAFARRNPGLQLRIGAYGDPVAVPLSVWNELLSTAAGFTAYTHSWQVAAPGYQPWCMASVDTDAQQVEAAARGWRTFRVRPIDGAVSSSEIVCPHEQDESIKCANCSLCRGAARPAKHIVVTVHGNGQKHFSRAPVDLRPRLIPLASLRTRGVGIGA